MGGPLAHPKSSGRQHAIVIKKTALRGLEKFYKLVSVVQPPDPHLHHQLGCCIPAAQCLFHECTYTLLIRSSLKVPLPARCTVTALLLSGLPTRARFLEGGFAPFKSLHMADIGGAPTSGLQPRRGQNQPFRKIRRVFCGLSSPDLNVICVHLAKQCANVHLAKQCANGKKAVNSRTNDLLHGEACAVNKYRTVTVLPVAIACCQSAGLRGQHCNNYSKV